MSFKSITISIVSTFVFCGVLCSTFVNYGANDCYFLLFPLMVSIGVTSLLAFILSILKGNNFRFKLPDVLITAGVFYYLMRYDYQLHLADWKVIYAAILLLLWYVVRIIFSSLQVSKNIVSVGIVGIGCMLAGWGLLQLYSFCHSNHLLFVLRDRSSILDLIQDIWQCCFLSVFIVCCLLKVGDVIAGWGH